MLSMVLVHAGTVRAQDVPPVASATRVRLDYRHEAGIPRCPEVEGIRDAVARRMGRDPFSGTAEAVVVASIRRGDAGLTAEVSIHGGGHEGTRTILGRGADCLALSDAVTLAIRLAVESNDAAHTEPPPPAPTPVAAVPAPAPTPARDSELTPVVQHPRPPAALRDRWSIGGGATGVYGLVPGLAVGGIESVRLRLGAWSVEALARQAVTVTALSLGVGVVRSDVFALDLGGCRHVSVLALCARVEGAALPIRGQGYATNENGLAWALGLGAFAEVDFARVGPLGFFGAVGGWVYGVRPSVVVGNLTATAATPFAATADLGIRLYFQ